MNNFKKTALLLSIGLLTATSSAICQTDTASKVCINRRHVLCLIKDVEQGDICKQELDTLTSLYVQLQGKSALQDSIIAEQENALSICRDGWEECEALVAYQKKSMEKYKARQKNIKNIGKGIIAALVAALILK